MLSRINKKNKKKKASKETVFVGLSGGVDSAVSAHILKKRGYEVVGVFIKPWQPPFVPCTWVEDRLSAMRVAAEIGIPFKTVDLSEEYKKNVVFGMIDGYKNGITPNPDVLCNKTIKFGLFLSWAIRNGASFVATGHYAKIQEVKIINYESGKEEKFFGLYKGADQSKDQSYFLWTLTKEQLSHTLFPVGEMLKEEVRFYAKKAGLSNFARPDSQGVCFIGDIEIKDFLKRFLPIKRGDVLLPDGRKIGHHDGAHFFTIGERHGFKITEEKFNQPLYVVGKDTAQNVLTVDFSPEAGKKQKVSIQNLNLIGEWPKSKEIKCRVRHLGELVDCDFDGAHSVIFKRPVLVSPGQSLVFYEKERCLGGGIIEYSS